MNVADKLRRAVSGRGLKGPTIVGNLEELFGTSGEHDTVLKIADEIDHEFIQMDGFVERLREASMSREDITVFGTDYMPYPLDVRGKPIHINDCMEHKDGECFDVAGIGKDTLFYVDFSGDHAEWTVAHDKCHHSTSIEELLLDFHNAVTISEKLECDCMDELLAKYAERIRLCEKA